MISIRSLLAASALFLFIFLPNVGLLDYHIGHLLTVLPNWLGDSDIALYAIMVITVWKNAGYYMLFFLAGLQAVPEDAMEAAMRITELNPRPAQMFDPDPETTSITPELLIRLRDNDIAVDEITVSKPSLDEVFLTLTGHGAEDDAETERSVA